MHISISGSPQSSGTFTWCQFCPRRSLLGLEFIGWKACFGVERRSVLQLPGLPDSLLVCTSPTGAQGLPGPCCSLENKTSELSSDLNNSLHWIDNVLKCIAQETIWYVAMWKWDSGVCPACNLGLTLRFPLHQQESWQNAYVWVLWQDTSSGLSLTELGLVRLCSSVVSAFFLGFPFRLNSLKRFSVSI